MLVLHRPARIESDAYRLDDEYRSARWLHHRLLDFEDEHQRVLDAAAEAAAPGIVRVGRILARLSRRAKRRERSNAGTWSPHPRPDLAATLRARLEGLRKQRNADPRWKAALKWADEQVGDPKVPRRQRGETDEHYAAKLANPRRDTRRDQCRKQLYAERRVYWGTWNGLLKSVDQARKSVIKQRAQGLPAEWRRPRWSDRGTLYAEPGGFRVVERGPLWWVIEMRLGLAEEWVQVRAKCGNWHEVPEGARIVTAKLTRDRDGERWRHSVSLTADMDNPTAAFAQTATVAFDWGHREYGHDRADDGLRVFTWLGSDGAEGEVLLPRECRALLDAVDATKGRLDGVFNARKDALCLPDRNRHGYRRRLMRAGVRSAEETRWLRWERRQERRLARARRRIDNLRGELYLQTVRALRKRYKRFVFEAESNRSLKQKAKDEQSPRRRRSNRDLSARYLFTTICERFGAELITVSARNTTRECPDCGFVGENGPELLYACPGCGRVRDKDQGAARVILARGEEALAEQGAQP